MNKHIKNYLIFFSILITFLFLSFTIPVYTVIERASLEALLSISTFLFSILAGFSISILNSRLSGIFNAIASGNSALITFYELSKLFGKKTEKRVADILDSAFTNLMITPVQAADAAKEQFRELYKVLGELEVPKGKKEYLDNIIGYMAECLSINQQSNDKIRMLISKKFSKRLTTSLMLLGVIIIVLLFILKENTTGSIILTALLSTTTILVLIIVKELYALKMNEELIFFETSNYVFDAINRPRVYHIGAIKRGVIKLKKGYEYKIYQNDGSFKLVKA